MAGGDLLLEGGDVLASGEALLAADLRGRGKSEVVPEKDEDVREKCGRVLGENEASVAANEKSPAPGVDAPGKSADALDRREDAPGRSEDVRARSENVCGKSEDARRKSEDTRGKREDARAKGERGHGSSENVEAHGERVRGAGEDAEARGPAGGPRVAGLLDDRAARRLRAAAAARLDEARLPGRGGEILEDRAVERRPAGAGRLAAADESRQPGLQVAQLAEPAPHPDELGGGDVAHLGARPPGIVDQVDEANAASGASSSAQGSSTALAAARWVAPVASAATPPAALAAQQAAQAAPRPRAAFQEGVMSGLQVEVAGTMPAPASVAPQAA